MEAANVGLAFGLIFGFTIGFLVGSFGQRYVDKKKTEREETLQAPPKEDELAKEGRLFFEKLRSFNEWLSKELRN